MQAQAPAYVSTKMTNVKATWSAPSAGRYAAAAVRHVGYEDYAVPYYKHALDRCATPYHAFPCLLYPRFSACSSMQAWQCMHCQDPQGAQLLQ